MTWDEARDYELLTQAVFQSILRQEGVTNIDVEHNARVPGRSGVSHQCDVHWRFKQAGVEHTVIVECKHYKERISLGHVRSFSAVTQDIGARGLMVTTEGYQSGAESFAQHNNIGLKILRKPRDEDWEGRVKNVHTKVTLRGIDDSQDHSPVVTMQLDQSDPAIHQQVVGLQEKSGLDAKAGSKTRLYRHDGHPATEEFGNWLPRQLNFLHKDAGGPYTERIDASGLFVRVNPNTPDEALFPLQHLDVTYFVKVIAEDEIVVAGKDVVQAMLKDFVSGEIEHVQRRER